MAEKPNDLDGLNDFDELPADDSAGSAADASGTPDPNDEVPVPIAMWPAEIDERAQVVDALRGKGPPPRTDTQVDPNTDDQADRA
ncbi:MAG TPA: hypothetical protein VGM67_15635 [Gemmatimonadaceae bacterium]